MAQWLVENWFDSLSALGIISGFIFTAVSLRSETKARRVSNFLTVIGNHREIWKEFLEQPKLARVLDASADVTAQPVTTEEELFVNMVILHVSTTYYAMNDELLMKLEGARPDIAQFFALPVPNAVWQRTRPLQNQDFAAFMESALTQ